MNPNKLLLLLIIVLLSISYSLAITMIKCTIEKAGDIPNYAGHNVTKESDFKEALDALNYDNVYNKEGTIKEIGNVRIERTGFAIVSRRKWKTVEGHVIGVKGNSLISQVAFPNDLKDPFGDISSQLNLVNCMDNALYESYISGKVYKVVRKY
ncbi:hypothetical protein DDB_G0293998 [Dictyostelium discoideum AX4]|uniref:Uncharacterized protein n=1 Tax=Dictyostelium discoideum TaxID=44689 RepID=Q54B02_DICDI|nr:hypothetical protein DDB_G0293998 [Dictyostelium discoideum AX4]EAL60441.1 hypothetical protein DDB_G0293998 [Dictyostelium discoideum AX4]|eukprot:XP_628857.1 hypothetical protein DDB_G0293998 [Dictyostelium discoideum AX4]